MPLFVFDNHDNPRSIDRFGDGEHDTAIAKGLAAVLLLPRAAALTYYGAEIGMRTDTPKRREDVRDPIGIVGWPQVKGRDGERTPMQWTAGPQAGFSSNPKTWLPVNPDHVSVNVATESADPASLYNWFRHLIALRHTQPALLNGKTVMLDKIDPDVLVFARIAPGARAMIAAINMSAKPRTVAVDKTAIGRGKLTLLASSDPQAKMEADTFVLPPFATIVAAAGDAPAQH
jgi:alpha-glucosidase